VTRGEWAAFVLATGRAASGWCFKLSLATRNWGRDDGADWSKPGFAQTDRHPAICINWRNAKAYVGWLSHKTGKPYRLPSEAEWEYAARAGVATSHVWGDDPVAACRHANGADASAKAMLSVSPAAPCDDGYVFTAPVGSYLPNLFGLHDLTGNVQEWVEDCWHSNYVGAPVDGSAWVGGGDCSYRVLRGGSWGDGSRHLRAVGRNRSGSTSRNITSSFRVARELE
jgi:formylglycine-generating enzyme required for sulfatase activity